MKITEFPITCLLETQDKLGEGCFWDAEQGHLWWLDIVLPSRIHRLHLETGEISSWEFPEMMTAMARRAIIVVDVTRVSDSCGYGVPLMTLDGHRDHHALSVDKALRTLGPEGYAAKRAAANAVSLDGLPSVDA